MHKYGEHMVEQSPDKPVLENYEISIFPGPGDG